MIDNIENVITISLECRSGSDGASKLLLNHDDIKHTIVSSLTDGNINGKMYTIANNEHSDGKRSDVIYIPDKPTESTRPITVEIQQTFDWAFFRRLNRYCLNICDKYKVMPFVMVFAIKGFSSKSFMSEFILNDDGYYTISTKLWAKSLRIYTLDSIAEHVTIEKLNPIIALAYFLCAQEKSIIGLELCDNAHIQKLYMLADKIFEEAQMEKKSSSDIVIKSLKNAEKQFEKILKCIESGDLNQMTKIKKYAANGVQYVGKKRKLLEEEEEGESVTPIEEDENGDLVFVKKFMTRFDGKRMDWRACHLEGVENGFFTFYSSYLSLKGAYHKNRLR
ncbi:hypothetical protein RMATCC62417_16990 [Rhizopus microsporus]|nr:hypothetical protein RMATCC62417_16990 [Rhizopus microsporus]